MKIIYIVFVMVFSTFTFAQNERTEKDALLLINSGKSVKEIHQKVNKLIQPLLSLEKIILLEKLYKTSFKSENYDLTFDLLLTQTFEGQTDGKVLEDSIGQYYLNQSQTRYRRLEKAKDSIYVIQCHKNFPKANLEIGFTLRRLLRTDQHLKFMMLHENNVVKRDSIIRLIRKSDSIQEKIVEQIYIDYGYPGKSLVGTCSSTCALLFLNSTPTFKLKYIHLIQKAVDEKELNFDIKFAIDKTLYTNFGKSMYGNWLKNATLIVDLKEIRYFNNLLKIHPIL
jgi:hypothetical protein